MCFNIQEKRSFEEIKKIRHNTKKIIPPKTLVYLLGNDFQGNGRQVELNEIKAYASSEKMEYFELSFLND